MLLSKLPLELVHEILLDAILVHSTSRALALRLVCKRFSQEVQFVLFRWHLLDDFVGDFTIRLPYQNCKSTEFWHSYFVHRVLDASSPANVDEETHYALKMRKVAEIICNETDSDLKTTIEALCWPAIYDKFAYIPGIYLPEWFSYKLELDLLSAAAYLNVISLTRRLLQDPVLFKGSHSLLPSPFVLATYTGNKEIHELFQNHFQKHLPELEQAAFPDTTPSWDEAMKYRAGPEAISGAALGDNIDLLRSTIFPVNKSKSENTESSGQIVGPINRYLTQFITNAKCYAKSVEVYKYFQSLIGNNKLGRTGVPISEIMLGRWAILGNIEMVRFLLDIGADIRGWPLDVPLIEACRGGQEECVDLLLERGANPNFPWRIPLLEFEEWLDGFKGDNRCFRRNTGSAISMAAKAGSISIVQKLIDHGADLCHESNGSSALKRAVKNEDSEMVRFLLRLGVDLVSCGEPIYQYAHEEGLESMADLLEHEYLKLPVSKTAQWNKVANETTSSPLPSQAHENTS